MNQYNVNNDNKCCTGDRTNDKLPNGDASLNSNEKTCVNNNCLSSTNKSLRSTAKVSGKILSISKVAYKVS